MNDFWEFDIELHFWTQIKTINPPPSRYGFGFTDEVDEFNNEIFYVFGGQTLQGIDNRLYMYLIFRLNMTTNTWTHYPTSDEMPKIYNCCIRKHKSSVYVVTGVGNQHYNSTQGGLYRYNFSDQGWENMYQSDFDNEVSRTTYSYREKGGCLLFGDLLFVISGWNINDYKSIDDFRFVNLTDPKLEWHKYHEEFNSGRDSFSFSQKNDEMIGFGGFVGINKTLSNQISVIKLYNLPDIASPEYPSPDSRSFHSMTLINGKFYIFGGVNGDQLYNDVWVFDPEKIIWTSINCIGSIPSGRYSFAYGSQGDAIVIWGGIDYLGLKNDLYIFYTFSNTWELIVPTTTVEPTAAKGACLAVSIPEIYIYGGETNSGISNSLYVYNLLTRSYSLISTDRSVAYAACYIIDEYFYVIFGESYNSLPNKFASVYNTTGREWSVYLEADKDEFQPTRGVTLFINGSIIVIGGQVLNIYPFNNVTFYSPFINETSLKMGQIAEFPFNSAIVYYKTKFYVFGGGEVIGQSLIPSRSISRMYSIQARDICNDSKCKILCSEGTESVNEDCGLCKAGSYSNTAGNETCVPCTVGTYNPYSGSSSNRQCYPCGSGTYNNLTGQSYCVDCLAGYSCPPGSVTPSETINEYSLDSIQPALFTQASISSKIFNFEIIVGLTMLFLILFCACVEYTRKKLHKIDIYNKLHNYQINKVMMLKNTLLGGIASLVFVGIAIFIIGSTFINFIDYNILETKSLVPKAVLDEEVDVFVSDKMLFVIKFLRYGDNCESIVFFTNNLEYSKMRNFTNKDSKTCTFTIELFSCSIEVGAYIKVTSLETLSYASGIEVNVTTNSSIPGELSSLVSKLSPDGNKVFIGPDASSFYFVMTPSLFKSEPSNYESNLKGYHVAVSKLPTRGSQFITSELSVASQLNVEIYLTLSNSGLYTYRYYKQSLIFVATALLGSIFGIMGAVGGVMSFLEKHGNRIKNSIRNKKKFNTISGNRSEFNKQFDDAEDLNHNGDMNGEDEQRRFTRE